jgi:hypothetical protein
MTAELIVEEAVSYGRRGWAVFPVRSNKAPATPPGFKDARADPHAVRSLFEAHPGCGVGISTGAASGLLVLDIDPDAGGDDALFDLERENGPLPDTVEVLTGGGGRHLYFAHPGGEIRSSAGKLGPGLDVRADGGYVVAPPSPHPAGRRYEWEVSHHPDETTIAAAPGWLLELLLPNARSASAAPVGDPIRAGTRNGTLASLAGSMRRRGMSEREIAAALEVVNRERCQPPLEQAEVERIAASISRYDQAQSPGITGEQKAPPFEVMSARDLCLLPDPPESDYLLGPVLVRGTRTVLGAHTGEGKTTLALEMAAAVALQREFLEWTGGGDNVLVIDAEQGLRTIKHRLGEAGLDRATNVDYLRVPDGLNLDVENGADVARLDALLKVGGYDLVIADPLYKLHRGDSNDERQAVDLMRRLDRWREELRFALLMLVHLRKPPPQGAKFSIHEFFGSGGYLRGAEVALGIRRTTPGYARLHFFKDRDGDLPVGESWGLIFDRREGFRRDPNDGQDRETSVTKVHRALEERPGRTLEDLVTATGNSDKTVRTALKKLWAVHQPGLHGAKLWSLPPDERDDEV